jgi:hypothetical protein
MNAPRIDFDGDPSDPRHIRIRDEWLNYLDRVVPKEAGPVQIQVTRDSFYAGFLACLNITSRLGCEDISEDDGAEIIERLYRELMKYKSQILRRVK